jgi:hypothetical protein
MQEEMAKGEKWRKGDLKKEGAKLITHVCGISEGLLSPEMHNKTGLFAQSATTGSINPVLKIGCPSGDARTFVQLVTGECFLFATNHMTLFLQTKQC